MHGRQLAPYLMLSVFEQPSQDGAFSEALRLSDMLRTKRIRLAGMMLHAIGQPDKDGAHSEALMLVSFLCTSAVGWLECCFM